MRYGLGAALTWALDTVGGLSVQQNPSDSFHSNFWLSTLLIDPATGHTPDELRLALADRNIESRLLWRPMHMQPVFADAPYYGNNIEDELFGRGLCLPSGSVLSDADINRVTEAIKCFMA